MTLVPLINPLRATTSIYLLLLKEKRLNAVQVSGEFYKAIEGCIKTLYRIEDVKTLLPPMRRLLEYAKKVFHGKIER